MNGRRAAAAIAAAVAAGIAGCDNTDGSASAGSGVRETGFPGQVSAGGGASGEVMARAGRVPDTRDPSGTPGIPQGSGGNTGGAAMGGTSGAASAQEGVRGQSPASDVSGTPGIPEGAGGTPSGAAMGGTTGGAAATQAPPQQQSAAARKQLAAEQAEKEKQELAGAMDKVAKRWRRGAAENGWETHPPTPVAAVPGFEQSATQSSPSGQPGGRLGSAADEAPVRSEKLGTAPPSPDVKDPEKKGK